MTFALEYSGQICNVSGSKTEYFDLPYLDNIKSIYANGLIDDYGVVRVNGQEIWSKWDGGSGYPYPRSANLSTSLFKKTNNSVYLYVKDDEGCSSGNRTHIFITLHFTYK